MGVMFYNLPGGSRLRFLMHVPEDIVVGWKIVPSGAPRGTQTEAGDTVSPFVAAGYRNRTYTTGWPHLGHRAVDQSNIQE